MLKRSFSPTHPTCSSEAGQGALTQIPSLERSDSQGKKNGTLNLSGFHTGGMRNLKGLIPDITCSSLKEAHVHSTHIIVPSSPHKPTCTEQQAEKPTSDHHWQTDRSVWADWQQTASILWKLCRYASISSVPRRGDLLSLASRMFCPSYACFKLSCCCLVTLLAMPSSLLLPGNKMCSSVSSTCFAVTHSEKSIFHLEQIQMHVNEHTCTLTENKGHSHLLVYSRFPVMIIA